MVKCPPSSTRDQQIMRPYNHLEWTHFSQRSGSNLNREHQWSSQKRISRHTGSKLPKTISTEQKKGTNIIDWGGRERRAWIRRREKERGRERQVGEQRRKEYIHADRHRWMTTSITAIEEASVLLRRETASSALVKGEGGRCEVPLILRLCYFYMM